MIIADECISMHENKLSLKKSQQLHSVSFGSIEI